VFLGRDSQSPSYQLRNLGKHCKISQRGLGGLRSPEPKLNLVHFSRKIWHLETTNAENDCLIVLTSIEPTAYARMLMIARKFLTAYKLVGLMPSLSIPSCTLVCVSSILYCTMILLTTLCLKNCHLFVF